MLIDHYYFCYDKSGDSFHRKNDGDDIEIDDKAKMLLDDIYPLIEKKCNTIYDRIIKELGIELDERYTLEKNYSNAQEAYDKLADEAVNCLSEIRKLGKTGSTEREVCIKLIAKTFYVSKAKLRKEFIDNDASVISGLLE